MNDQNLLTPAAMAGQLNEGGPVRRPKDQPGNGPRPKPQLSLWNAAQLLNGREGSSPPCPTCHALAVSRAYDATPFTGALHSTEPRISALCRLATMWGAATAHGQRRPAHQEGP